ncbi:MAG: hypothetical protein H6708_32970, partial [Kofleriaceae bacterium]|nr:hypothetical protein [Kofleriaceae bacterium]
MTSSATSTDRKDDGGDAAGGGRPPDRRWVVVMGGAGVGLVAGWAFILWHHRFHVTAPVVILMLSWAAAVGMVYFFWRTADAADLDDEQDWWRAAGRREELNREKKSLLKAIKETEVDRETGKLSPRDAADLIARYRGQAIEVIKALEALASGGADDATSVRDRIEREVRARLQVDRAARAGAPAAAAKGASAPV